MAAKNSGGIEPTATTDPTPYQKLLVKMAGLATLNTDDTSGEDISRILAAESEADMWESDDLAGYNAKVLSGCALVIYGFDVKWGDASNTEGAKPVFVDPATNRQMYLWIHSARIDKSGEKKEYRLPEPGEEFRWNTSAPRIVAKLFWMNDHGWFDPGHAPVKCRIEGTPIGGGKSVEKLKPLVPSGFESASEDTPF